MTALDYLAIEGFGGNVDLRYRLEVSFDRWGAEQAEIIPVEPELDNSSGGSMMIRRLPGAFSRLGNPSDSVFAGV